MRKLHWRAILVYFSFLFLAAAAAFFTHASAARLQSGGSGYHVVKKFKLGGEGGWDYLTLDPSTQRLFISRGTHVIVVDPDTGKVLGDIPGMHRAHGIAIATEFNHGFISDGEPGSVFMFDLKTLKVIREIKTQPDCDGIIYDPGSKRVFTMNGDSSDSTAIDAKTGEVLANIQLGGKPEFLASDGKGHVFGNLEDKSEMVKIDSQSLKLEDTWPLAPCESPSGLAIDAANERLFVGCHSKVMAFVDGNTGKVLGTVPIGAGVDANRFDPGTGYAFASCGDGTITVAHEDSPEKLTPVDMVQTQRGARTMEFDPKSHDLYTVTAEFGPEPPAEAGQRRRRPPILPDTFTLLVLGR